MTANGISFSDPVSRSVHVNMTPPTASCLYLDDTRDNEQKSRGLKFWSTTTTNTSSGRSSIPVGLGISCLRCNLERFWCRDPNPTRSRIGSSIPESRGGTPTSTPVGRRCMTDVMIVVSRAQRQAAKRKFFRQLSTCNACIALLQDVTLALSKPFKSVIGVHFEMASDH